MNFRNYLTNDPFMGGNNSRGWNIPLQGVTKFSLGVPDLVYFGCLGRGWECRSCRGSVVTICGSSCACSFWGASAIRFFLCNVFLRAAAELESGLTLLRAAVQLWHNFLSALGYSRKSSHRFFHWAFNTLRSCHSLVVFIAKPSAWIGCNFFWQLLTCCYWWFGWSCFTYQTFVLVIK